MKQKDIAVVIAVAGFAGLISFFVANKIFVTDENRQQKYQVVDDIEAEMNPMDTRYFNADSINPTRNTSDAGSNQAPFNSSDR